MVPAVPVGQPLRSVFISPGELSSHMRDSENGFGKVPQTGVRCPDQGL